jgi:hypothetical protein
VVLRVIGHRTVLRARGGGIAGVRRVPRRRLPARAGLDRSPLRARSGAVLYWHVDDVEAAVERLLSMGAREYEALTHRGEEGFVTALVVDPFGNVLGIMYNPHYLEVLASTR